jgi:hypothetical protein
MASVAPSERLRRELDDGLNEIDGDADPLERIGRLGARLVLPAGVRGRVHTLAAR